MITEKELALIIKQVKKDISNLRKQLRKGPLIENFGQKEVRTLRDKYAKYKYNYYTRSIIFLIDDFDCTLMNCENPSHL